MSNENKQNIPPLVFKTNKQVNLICAADVISKKISWIIPEIIAKGKIHLIAGVPGLGKSTLSLSLAAMVSSGQVFFDENRCDAGKVLIFSRL